MIDFDFYPTPNPDKSDEKRYHARVVAQQNIDTEQLVEEIQRKSGLSAGAVEDVLITFADRLASHLGDGNRVYLKKVGYFQVNLKCKKEISNPHDARPENVAFKSVSFRADNSLKNKLREEKIKRSKEQCHSRKRTEDGIDTLLAKHFETKPAITRRGFQVLTGLLRTTAYRRLKDLADVGKLKNIGTNRSPVYVPCEGYFGK